MEYTLQRELDYEGFGGRWGCYACSLINIVETERGRKLHESELNQIIGAWFRLRLVILSNYKDHKKVLIPGAEKKGWSAEADPEWHYWVTNTRAAIMVAMEIMDLQDLAYDYNTIIMDVSKQGGTKHYALQIIGGDLINPDPALLGPTLETRRIQV